MLKEAVPRLNVFKNLRNGPTQPRAKFILDLEKNLPNARRIPDLLREARPYSLRADPMDSDPILLQIRNATVDLMANTISGSRPGCYLAKCADVVAPDYARGGGDSSDPESASDRRDWAYKCMWSLFCPGADRITTTIRLN